jgi:multidrug efflux pump subunit AcrA (membrane-fusion protein)
MKEAMEDYEENRTVHQIRQGERGGEMVTGSRGEEEKRRRGEEVTGSRGTVASSNNFTRSRPHPFSLSPLHLFSSSPLLIVALLIAVALNGCSPKKAAEEEKADVLVSVRVAKAEREDISAEVTAIGTVVPKEIATISSNLNAPIKRMALLKNRAVRAGETLAILESRDLQAQLREAQAAADEARLTARNVSAGTIPETQAQDEKALRDARANVANARATYERRQTLYRQGGISQKELEASQLALTTAENELRLAESRARVHDTTSGNERALAQARVNQAEQRVAALRTQLSYTSIRAPFSGVVTEQFQYEGEYASAGGKLLTIADMSEVIVKAPVSDSVAAQLQVGSPVKILPEESAGEEFTDKIALISRATDQQNRAVEIWVRMKNPGNRLRAGGAAKVIIAAQSASDTVVVPASAVTLETANASEGTVMIVDDQSVAREVKVTAGIRTPERIEITSGLKGGETVIVEGNYALPDNTKVQISEEGEEEEKGEKADEKEGGEK